MKEVRQDKSTPLHTKDREEEEIDIMQLVRAVGRMFSSFFNSIGVLLKVVFYWFVDIIVFIRRHAIKIVVGTAIGAILGGVYEYRYKVVTYESSMTVQPNFGSVIQLYKDVDYYESLIRQNDISKLSIALKITKEEALSIRKISVEPYTNKSQVILSYQSFVSSLDSTIVGDIIDYAEYSEDLPVESFKFHIVTVVSSDKNIFSKLRTPILEYIVRNNFYKKKKEISRENLVSLKNTLEVSIAELNRLKDVYTEVMIAESKREVSGTNIFMQKSGKSEKELLVFEKQMEINEELRGVREQINTESEVVNVVSSFNSIGMKVGGIFSNGAFIGILFGFLLVVGFLGIKDVNKLLIDYEKKR